MLLGGANPLPTTRTIPHWWSSALDPHDGVTYGFNMVGADPYGCSGFACDFTIEVDITPLIVNIDGMTFSGMDVIAALLASPMFAANDYSSTPFATTGPATVAGLKRGPGGPLSQADAGQLLQLLDAQMRAQFNKTGVSNYHLRLHPNILPPVTLDVPSNLGVLLQSGRGVVFGATESHWWGAQIENLLTIADPTHFALYLTDDVFNYVISETHFLCCLGGYHGVMSVGAFHGAGNSQGDAPLHTFAYASWLSPGIYARPNGGLLWHIQDVYGVDHEISEWANDPFDTNNVEPWGPVLGFPGNSCVSHFLEVGDVVQNSGYAIGTNTFRQGPNPDGSQSADGYYHPQDAAFVPWFMRLSPNLFSEPTQTPSPNVGRYSFIGNLNEFVMNQPAPACVSLTR
jgi:hypothetical protein